MEYTYEYDGTFDGLLSVFYDIFICRNTPYAIAAGKVEFDLYSVLKKIETSKESANKFSNHLKEHFTENALRNIYLAFLSQMNGIEMDIYRYVKYGIEVGKKLNLFVQTDCVKKIQDTVSKVLAEAHNMKGFIRFSKIGDDILYAEISPDHFVLPLIGVHFKQRLGSRKWAVHDCRRKKVLICDGQKYEIADIVDFLKPEFDDTECDIAGQWRTFFNAIAVETRKNPRQQDRFLPRRYRKFMTEFQK